jgi:hypothetical protein
MRSTTMIARRWFLLGFAAAVAAGYGCSSSSSSSGTSTPALSCTSGGAAAANGVTMTCGGAVDSQTEQVDVTMGGPSSGTTTIRGLNFDVTYSTTNLTFVPAGNYVSPLFPGALIAVSLFNNQPGRVVVSIQTPAGSPDVSVAPGQHVALSLSFQRSAGMVFGPSPLTLENAEATSASATITFANGLALSYQ